MKERASATDLFEPSELAQLACAGVTEVRIERGSFTPQHVAEFYAQVIPEGGSEALPFSDTDRIAWLSSASTVTNAWMVWQDGRWVIYATTNCPDFTYTLSYVEE